MSPALNPEAARVVRFSAGRLRIHLPQWDGSDRTSLEQALASIPGVRAASARPQTGNALIEYDTTAADRESILRQLSEVWPPRRARAGRSRRARGRRRTRPRGWCVVRA